MEDTINLHDIAVLATDDVEDNLDLIEEFLEGEVWSVLRANSGDEAIRLADEHAPDVILLDLMMPRMNGLAVIRAIRATESIKDVGIILQTAYADKENIVTAKRMGCDRFLCKPLTRDRLLSEIRECLKDRPDRASRRVDHLKIAGDPGDGIAVSVSDPQQMMELGKLSSVLGDEAVLESVRDLIGDPSKLGQRLVQVANSPLYDGSAPVQSVTQAIVRLGPRKTRDLIKKTPVSTRGSLTANRADEVLTVLESIARVFPARISTTDGMLAVLDEVLAPSQTDEEPAATASGQ